MRQPTLIGTNRPLLTLCTSSTPHTPPRSYPHERPRPLQPSKSRANPLTHVGFSLRAVGACLGVIVDNFSLYQFKESDSFTALNPCRIHHLWWWI
ncbi:hypothetical protein [Moraxella bovis]|uniref:hypothetical protein n=1 Tax=Moraxella bovis TaxID=476 RepID=UPI0011C06965|nr:hypothetical protein [Moraxella bovis]